MYPVDLLRALRMGSAADAKQGTATLVRNFLNTYGVKGLFNQGVAPEILRATAMRVSKFFFYPIMHRGVFDQEPSKGTAVTRAVAGALATIPESFGITPIEIAKIGLQLDKENRFKNNARVAINTMFKSQGVVGLYTGFFGILYRQAAWTGAYFGSLNSFSKLVEKDLGLKSVFWTQLLSGFAAGVFGSVFNTPGDVIRSVIQKRAVASTSRYAITPALLLSGVTEFFKVGAEVIKTKGIQGLYYGFGFKAIHLGGSGALLAWLVPLFKGLLSVTKE